MGITQEMLQELFVYDPLTGLLTNKVNRRTAKEGDEAGGLDVEGYRVVSIKDKLYKHVKKLLGRILHTLKDMGGNQSRKYLEE